MRFFSLVTIFLLGAVVTRAAESTAPPELASLKRQYEQSITPVEERCDSRVVNLQKEYFVALTQLHQDLLKDDDLDAVLAVKKELERFEYKQEITESQKRDMFPKLRTLRDNYEQGLQRIDLDRANQKRALAQQYVASLQSLEKRLFQKGDTNGVALARDAQEEILGTHSDLAGEFTSGRIEIRAYIDGVDVIKVRGKKLWYEHVTAELPGKWDGHDEPTFVNQEKWMPWWDGHTSRPYEKITAMRPPTGKRVYVAKKFGRGVVTLAQQPSTSNEQTLKITIDDVAHAGADWYEIHIKW